MSPEIAISVRDVAKKFRLFVSVGQRLAEALHPQRKAQHREFWALDGVSFDIRRGEIVGILGRNGSGKSTLLQIICSVMQPTRGQVEVSGRISALLELGAGFNPEFSGRENVILNGAIMGLDRKEMMERLPAIEAFADIGEFFDQPVKTYSSGMFVRVAFAAAIHVEPEILVVDEALSVGDSKFQHRCFQRIREFMEQGKTILVVSHSTDTLLRICHRGVVLDRGTMSYQGPIADAVNHYQNILFGTVEKPATSAASGAVAGHAAPEGLSSLRWDTRDRLAEKTAYNPHETRLGDGVAKILDFDLLVDGLPNPPEIPTHAVCELILNIHVEYDVQDFYAGFALVSLDGTYVFGTNLAMMNRRIGFVRAGTSLLVKFFWRAHIAGGDYFLNLGCNRMAGGEERYVDVRRSAAKLKFASTPQLVGFVDLEIRHELVELQPVVVTGLA